MKLIERVGYGSSFNELVIIGTKLRKRCKNDYGLTKIRHEIEFYKFIHSRNITFPTVKILNFLDDGYEMEYLDEYKPIYKTNFDLKKVYDSLELLHGSYEIPVSREYFMEQLHIEINDKIIKRYETVKDSINKYDFITHVNGVKLLSFECLHKKINNEINAITNSMNEYKFVPIHGDCQFNNILSNGEDMVFIDPRGYYGESKIFGMKEYDMAKVLFALSGYDEFDSREIKELNIVGNNINIELNYLESDIFNRPKLEVLLMINIWMGNAHSFKNDECKMISSYFISLYLGSIFLKDGF